MSTRIAFATGLVFLGVLAAGTGAGSVDAMPVAPLLKQVRVVTLPHPSPGLASNLPKHAEVQGAFAVSGRGQILAAGGNYNLEKFDRFDPRRKRWLPGAMNISVAGPCCGLSYLLVGKTMWTQNYPYGISKGTFSGGKSDLEEEISANKGGWGEIPDVAAGGEGRVWIAGSHERTCFAGYQGWACGHTAIGLADSRSTQTSPITLGWWGIETSIAVARNGSVWLVLPEYKGARHDSCCQSALIRYDPGDRRFTRFVIPRQVWPEAASRVGVTGTIFIQGNGSVWIVCFSSKYGGGRVRFVRFRDGSFTSHSFNIPFSSSPVLDRNGKFWYELAGTRPHITDPLTGRTTVLHTHCGAVLGGPHGSIWCVKWHG